MLAMKQSFVRILSRALNAWYHMSSHGNRGKEALFLSRQSDSLSVDFKLLSSELMKHRGWSIVQRTQMVEDGTSGALKLVARMFGDVKALARCQVCFVEGYNPAVSLLNLKGIHASSSDYSEPWVVNSDFPTEPLVIQVWHAAGHFKKFGYEALDTPEGRSSNDARIARMHRNYSWIACSGEGARAGFAEAFGCPVERVVALGHPSFDELYRDPEESLRKVYTMYPQLEHTSKPIVVFAPTLHRLRGDAVFEELRTALESDPRSAAYELVWSFHPVTLQGTDIRVTTRDLLRCASLVITDYSSVVYDAALLDLPFAFYTPDIDEYRESPGLATDPSALAPGLCLKSPDEMITFLERAFEGNSTVMQYPTAERDAFIGTTLSACGPGSAKRIVDFTLSQLR